MIHLAGDFRDDRVKRALDELAIYEEEGVDGAIIEDYHGTPQDVRDVLYQTYQLPLKIIRGVNVLSDPYSGFGLANEFSAKFIQFDSVQTRDLNLEAYNNLRVEYPEILVLGGIGFKYTEPTGNLLEVDLEEGKLRCEAIVTTGSGTGIETPTEKLREYKRILGDFPLIVGAGVNLQNVFEQLQICNGAIVGSYFKPNGDTNLPIDRKRVKDLMDIAKNLRK